MAILKYKDPADKKWKQISVVSDGVTFIPSIDDNGELTWTNNGGLDNPSPVNLDSKEVVIKDNKADFPTVGNEAMIYIERSTNRIYRWNSATSAYAPLSGGEISISKEEGNVIEMKDDGLYAGATAEIDYTKAAEKIIELLKLDNLISDGKLKYTLTIGDQVFDGSKDITIETYEGEVLETYEGDWTQP